MLVLCAIIDVEVSQDSSTETVLGEHTLDDLAEEAVRALSLQEAGAKLTLSTGVARELKIDAVVPLLTSEDYLVGVDYDHVVPAVYVGREVGLVLTAKELSDLGAYTAQALSCCVHDDPLLGDGRLVGRDGLELKVSIPSVLLLMIRRIAILLIATGLLVALPYNYGTQAKRTLLSQYWAIRLCRSS